MRFRIEKNTLKGLLIHLSVVLGLFFLLSFTAFYKVLPFVTNKDQIVTVPDLKGMSVDKAKEFIKDKDLEIEVTDSLYNADFAPLTVLDQFPKPNAKVKVNRKINLKLNAKIPPTTAFPDLSGSTFELAQKQLRNSDLKIGSVEYRPDLANNIILESKLRGETIAAGQRISKGSTIHLVIGTFKDKFALPDFKNMSYDEVEAYILGMNLKVRQIHYLIENDEQVGTVKKQLPNGGDTVRLGDEVEIWIINKGE